MSPANSIDNLLKEIKDDFGFDEVTLISRSGKHIGGDAPKNAHVETFVTMSAILLGAAETATSELNEDLSHVLVDLEDSRIFIRNSGESALIAIKVSKNKDVSKIKEEIEEPIKKLEKLL